MRMAKLLRNVADMVQRWQATVNHARRLEHTLAAKKKAGIVPGLFFPLFVMPGLVPGIRVLLREKESREWPGQARP